MLTVARDELFDDHASNLLRLYQNQALEPNLFRQFLQNSLMEGKGAKYSVMLLFCGVPNTGQYYIETKAMMEMGEKYPELAKILRIG